MLVHRVWVRLGPERNNLFSCIFIARVRRDLEVANLFSFLFFLFCSIKMKQRGQRKCFVVGPKCCMWNFPPWLVSAQINNGVVKVSSASAFTAKVLLGACPCTLPQPLPSLMPTWGTRHRLPRGPPFSGTSWGCPESTMGTQFLVARYRTLPRNVLQHVKCTALLTLSLLSWRHSQGELSLVGEQAQRTDLLFRVLAQSRPENDVPSINTHMSHLL